MPQLRPSTHVCVFTFRNLSFQVLVLTIGWGMGNGMFLSVDYALVTTHWAVVGGVHGSCATVSRFTVWCPLVVEFGTPCPPCQACDVLPSLEHAAQSLGVWGVSAFLGSTLGPLIAGPLLTHFGSTTTADQYSTPGYVAVMLLGAVYVICAGLMLRTVRERVRGGA